MRSPAVAPSIDFLSAHPEITDAAAQALLETPPEVIAFLENVMKGRSAAGVFIFALTLGANLEEVTA